MVSAFIQYIVRNLCIYKSGRKTIKIVKNVHIRIIYLFV